MNRKNIFRPILAGALGLALLGGFFSCGKADPNSPGNEFMPDMYRSPSLEVYQQYVTSTGDTMWGARQPATGSISRGNIPGLPVGVGYENADPYRNPLPNVGSKEAFTKYADEGKVIYGKFCTHCHGASGAGDGKVAAKLPGPPPAYTSPNLVSLTDGRMFYSITYGKGMMGPHGPLLSVDERWKVVCYVQQLQGRGPGGAPAAADTTGGKTVTADTLKTAGKQK